MSANPVSETKRYDFTPGDSCGYQCCAEMIEAADGEWVRFRGDATASRESDPCPERPETRPMTKPLQERIEAWRERCKGSPAMYAQLGHYATEAGGQADRIEALEAALREIDTCEPSMSGYDQIQAIARKALNPGGDGD